MLASHRAVLGAFVALLPAALGTPLLLGLVGRGHAGNRDFLGHDRLYRVGKGELHRPAHLTAIDAG
jgi:hypothetical protein